MKFSIIVRDFGHDSYQPDFDHPPPPQIFPRHSSTPQQFKTLTSHIPPQHISLSALLTTLTSADTEPCRDPVGFFGIYRNSGCVSEADNDNQPERLGGLSLDQCVPIGVDVRSMRIQTVIPCPADQTPTFIGYYQYPLCQGENITVTAQSSYDYNRCIELPFFHDVLWVRSIRFTCVSKEQEGGAELR